jgi:sugar-specific transcriptional regulator TrmB
VELALQTYMDSQYQEWQEHMEKVFRSQDEMNANLAKRNPETQVRVHMCVRARACLRSSLNVSELFLCCSHHHTKACVRSLP